MTRLTIRGSGLSMTGYDVYLDDIPLTVKELQLHMAIGEINEATITFFVNDLYIDKQALATLRALVKKQEEGDTPCSSESNT